MKGPIVFLGQCVLEHVFRVTRLSAVPGLATAQDYEVRLGGRAAQAAGAAQALRRPRASPAVRLVTALGDDETGEWAARALERDNLAGASVRLVRGARTSVSAVLVDGDGERQIHKLPGNALERAGLPPADDWQQAAAVHTDARWPAAAQAALEAARARGIPSLLDAESGDTAVLQALVPLADWIVFSRDGLRAWAGTRQFIWQTQAKQVVKQFPDRHVVVTLGGDGVWWQAPGQAPVMLPPPSAAGLPADGAVLHGALLLGLSEGRRPEFALRWAVAAAALAGTRQPLTRAAVTDLLQPAT